MSRVQDIKEKLAYTQTKLAALKEELAAAQKSGTDVNHIGQKVGDILSGSRECFDYCAKDIADQFIATSPNTKVAASYTSGKAKAYFPFYQTQLTGNSLFSELASTAPLLHSHLLDLASKISAKDTIANTVATYDIATEVNGLVNDKKHDKITTATVRGNAATRVEFPGGGEVLVSPMYSFTGNRPDFGADVDAQQMVGTEGVKIQYVNEYRLTHNNWEVTRFCDHALLATTRILTEVYQRFFNTSADYLDPWETNKPPKIRAGEALLKTLDPMVVRPVRVVLLLDGTEVANIELDFNGLPITQGDSSEALAKVFLLLFENAVIPQFETELKHYVFNNPDDVDTSSHGPLYAELPHPLTIRKELTLPDGKRFLFDQVFWGIGYKLRCTDSIQHQPAPAGSALQCILALLDQQTAHINITFDAAGQVSNCTCQ